MGTAIFLVSNTCLTVIGSPANYDTPSPLGYQTHIDIPPGAWITNTVNSPVDQAAGLRHACHGWLLTDPNGALVNSGGTTQAVFQLTTNLTLTWLWTNEYELAVTAGSGGSVNSGTVNGWYTNGIVVSGILATPDPGYAWWKWTGDFPAGQDTVNPLTVTMNQKRTIQANFSLSVAQTNYWSGSNLWESATNWSLGSMPGTLDTAIIQTGSTAIITIPTQVSELIVTNGGKVVFSNWFAAITASNVTIASGGTIGMFHAFTNGLTSNRVWIVCTNLTVAAGGSINVDGKGYNFGAGPGAGWSSSQAYGSGGSHGGRGGIGIKGEATNTYGSIWAPDTAGSGGGNYTWNPQDLYTGGSGGGVIRIQALNVLIDGLLSANGDPAKQYAAGGAGGSIWITCGTWGGATNGLLQACGGSADLTSMPSGYAGGAGGGGRIAIGYTALAPQYGVRFRASPGSLGWVTNDWDRNWYYAARNGTLSLSDTALLSSTLANQAFKDVDLYLPVNEWGVDSLTVNNCSLTFANEGFRLTVTNGLTIDSNAKLGIGALNGGTNPAVLAVGQDLMVTNGGRLHVYSGTTNAAITNYGATVSVAGTVRIGPASSIQPYINLTNAGAVLLQVGNLEVAAGGEINADGKGYLADQGPGKGNRKGQGCEGGAGHGGKGCDGFYPTAGSGTSLGGLPYDSVSAPTLPGSGGGSYNNVGSPHPNAPYIMADNGGGVVRVIASGSVVVNGAVSADASDHTALQTYSGGGAGGAIYITCAALGGSGGLFSARGSGGHVYDAKNGAGGGGGGRIAINYASLSGTPSLGFTTLPGTGCVYRTAGDLRSSWLGTLWFPNTNLLSTTLTMFDGFINVPGFTAWSPASLTLNSASLGLNAGFNLNVAGDIVINGTNGMLLAYTNATVACGGNLTVTNSGQLRVYSGLTNGATDGYGALVNVGGDMTVASNAWVYPYAETNSGGSVLFRMNNLTVASFGGISADGAGFRNSWGPGRGTNCTPGQAYGGGGGYGGAGGMGGNNGVYWPGGPTYGSTNAPIMPGSGGGWYQNIIGMQGGRGGGAIRIAAAGKVTVNGTLSANGDFGDYAAGGGSGGGIFVTCNAFAGDGVMRVRGGDGQYYNPVYWAGGGGGGRIAIWYGVTEGQRSALLADPDHPPAGRYVVTNSYALFVGSCDVVGGTGYSNGLPGTVVFLNPIATQGTVLTIW